MENMYSMSLNIYKKNMLSHSGYDLFQDMIIPEICSKNLAIQIPTPIHFDYSHSHSNSFEI